MSTLKITSCSGFNILVDRIRETLMINKVASILIEFQTVTASMVLAQLDE